MSRKKPASQKDAFIQAAKAAGADEDEAAWEARLKAVAKHQPPLATIGSSPPRSEPQATGAPRQAASGAIARPNSVPVAISRSSGKTKPQQQRTGRKPDKA